MKKLLITNPRSGSVSFIGSRKIDIPGNAVDLILELPDVEAEDFVRLLRRRYPAITVKEGGAVVAKNATVAESESGDAAPETTEKKSKKAKA